MNDFETWLFTKADIDCYPLLAQMEFTVLGPGYESVPANTKISTWLLGTKCDQGCDWGAIDRWWRENQPPPPTDIWESSFGLRYFQVIGGGLKWFSRYGTGIGTNMFYGAFQMPNTIHVFGLAYSEPCHFKISMSSVPATILAQWNATIQYDCCTNYEAQTALTQTEICQPLGTFYNGTVPTAACDTYMTTYCAEAANLNSDLCSCMPDAPYDENSPEGIVYYTTNNRGQTLPKQCILPTCINSGYRTGGQVKANCPSFCGIVNSVKTGSWGTANQTNVHLTVNCGSNGIIQAQPTPECGRPTVPGGIPDCQSSVYAGNTCTWTPDTANGYKSCSNPARTCMSDGSWSGSPTSCIKFASCTTPVLPNAITNCTESSVANGTTCTYTAKPGFRCENTTQTCNDGKWDQASAPVCVPLKPCTVTAVPNTVSSCDGKTTVPNGTVCTSTPADGYSCTGGGNRTCTDGVWSGTTPSCTQIVCPPKTVEGGTTSCLKTSLPGTKCTYAPQEPAYVKCVNNEITCGPTGDWDKTPKCYKAGESEGSGTITIVVIATVVAVAVVGGIVVWRVMATQKK